MGHLACLYKVALGLEQWSRRGQVLSFPGGIAEYLFHIGSGEVGLAYGVGLLVAWLARDRVQGRACCYRCR